jgi:hypothetical protein
MLQNNRAKNLINVSGSFVVNFKVQTVNMHLLNLLVCIFFLGFILESKASDTIRMLKPILAADKRADHKDEIITRALELTVPEFGPFNFKIVNVDMTPGRALSATKNGELINLFIAPHNEIWDKGTIPIKIPIRQGLLSYRLLLIHKRDLKKFENVENIDDLKVLIAGLQGHWVTTKIFKDLGFNLQIGNNFEGLFHMLDRGRFDYFPRAIYEIYDELNSRKSELPNILIEPTLALYLPMKTYVYVSPKAPRVAKRMESGLSQMLANGDMKAILEKYYGEDISKANLKNRRIIKIENTDRKDDENMDEDYILHSTARN